MAMPLVGKMSSLSEQWFLDKTTDSIDSNLPKGIVTKSKLSLSAEIETNEELSNKYLLSGKIDLLVEFEDGNFGIYDCKNSSGDSDNSWMYYTQLAAYKYCFEQMNLGNVSHLGLIYQIIDSYEKNIFPEKFKLTKSDYSGDYYFMPYNSYKIDIVSPILKFISKLLDQKSGMIAMVKLMF